MSADSTIMHLCFLERSFLRRVVLVGASAGACVTALAQQESHGPHGADVRTPRVMWHVGLRAPSFGGASTADADGDGVLEIAFATYFGDSAVHVLNGEDGTHLWKYQGGGESTIGECFDASCKFADLDGDGALELVVPVSNTSLVLAFDAKTGEQQWKYEAGYGECIDTPPTIVDVTGDEFPEISVGTFKGNVHVIDGRTGERVHRIHLAPGAVQSGPTILELNNDGALEIVAANFKGDHAVHAIRLAPNAPIEINTLPDSESNENNEGDSRELWTIQTGSHIYHGCSFGDLDGDGVIDLTTSSYDGCVYAARGSDGELLWKTQLGERYIMSPTAIADLDGDDKPEVITATHRLNVLNGAEGSIRYSRQYKAMDSGHGTTRGVAVADMDGDGSPDIVFAGAGGILRVVRGHDGELLYEFNPRTVNHRPNLKGDNAPIIADFNNDGKLDVFYVVGFADPSNDRSDGHAICLTGFEGPAGEGKDWRMFRHDHMNSGNTAHH